jgi:hypothetical protein
LQLLGTGGPREALLLRSKLQSGDYAYVLYMQVRAFRPAVGFLAPMYRSGELELVKQKHFVRANGYVLKVGRGIRRSP